MEKIRNFVVQVKYHTDDFCKYTITARTEEDAVEIAETFFKRDHTERCIFDKAEVYGEKS